MKKILLLAMVILTAYSCTKDVTPAPARYYDTNLSMKVFNAIGTDMLDQTKAYSYRHLNLYHYINGEKTQIIGPMADVPKRLGYEFHAPQKYPANPLYIDLYKDWSVNISLSASECKPSGLSNSRTLIEWNLNNVDTVVTQFLRPSQYESIKQKIWINGELIWDLERDGKLIYYTKII